MSLLKEILTKQAAVPARVEQSLPPTAPKISTTLVDIASTLPDGPDLPELPVAPEDEPPPQIFEIIQGIDDLLPDLPGVEPPANGGNGELAARRAKASVTSKTGRVVPKVTPLPIEGVPGGGEIQYVGSPSVGVVPEVITRRGM